ncbi:MAG: hypothetical protein HOD97_08405 [Candidatus Marinimicrobia bacterium]|jgi:CDP-glycerol glycerophosphotransferase (TagB/SpsB family)|nr:hypothetical protein [Candidatus Neomarinimicrobiota bacterium]MBT3618219.1 hypothetical protein [Candidatus Neomarinimicrobiota bacterium]MBT3829545.1 hypothetical protein [Candidatus Neomarinimicrobiota bacterium]MBT3997428.1 hypothetical protein [Candidatus Neomarinimicrobiota bacterium]MBT4281618.1 hypothetical protein [Candidatus Neomarinimicrobiota bacterium]
MKSVLFESHHLYYLPQFIPIIEAMQKRESYSISASISKSVDESEMELFQTEIKRLGINYIHAETEQDRLEALKNAKFDIVVVGNIGRLNQIVADHTIAVLVYHGIGLKNTYYWDTDERIDLRSVESENRFRDLENAGEKNQILTGFTKLDGLTNQSYSDMSKQWEKSSLERNRKTVLYAPSFYPSSQEKFLPFISDLAKQVNVVIKLHDFSWRQKKYQYQGQAALALAKNHNNIFVVPPEEYNILPWLEFSDLLISDISSVLFEFLVLDRPIVQTDFYSLKLRHRLFPKKINNRLDLQRASEIGFAKKVKDPKLVIPVVLSELKNPEKLSDQRKSGIKTFLYKADGQASIRLIDAIEEKMQTGESL